MKPSISVIIPFYRRQDLFSETLQSVLDQTIDPEEIIVVDDASGGSASEFLSQFEPAIKLISLSENVGVSEARNIGARSATGEYLAFLDSDDLWVADKLARQLSYLREHPDCDAVHTGTSKFYPDGRTIDYIDKPPRLSKKGLVHSTQLMCQSLMMRRDDFFRIGEFDRSFRQTEDYEFSMRMVVNGMNVDFIAEPLVMIRRDDTGHLSNNWKGFISGHVRVVWKYARVYQQYEGYFGVIKHTGKYLIKGGSKRGGITGRLVSFLGLCLYPTFKE